MPKIPNWSRMDSFPGEAGWKHDEKRITVVVEGPTMARDGYRVVKRQDGAAFTLYRKRGTKERAMEDAREWMQKHPEGEIKPNSGSPSQRRSRANRGR